MIVDTESEIADYLSDAVAAADKAYSLAKEAWGEDDSRTEAINAAWAEVEIASALFKK